MDESQYNEFLDKIRVNMPPSFYKFVVGVADEMNEYTFRNTYESKRRTIAILINEWVKTHPKQENRPSFIKRLASYAGL